MKFTDKRAPIKTVPFENIKIGECFITSSDNHLNMKMYVEECAYSDTYNTVDLSTGEPCYFKYDEEVIPVTTEIIITD